MDEKQGKTKMICLGCFANFSAYIGKHRSEIKCPKCGGVDTDVQENVLIDDVGVS